MAVGKTRPNPKQRWRSKAVRAWLQRMMAGRYGGDPLGRFLCVASLVCMVLGLLWWDLLYYAGFVLLGYSYFRMLSRNIPKRYAENQWYMAKSAAARQRLAQLRQRFALRRQYRYFRCPHCAQQLRVPRGHGRISINCPKCGTQFIKKS